MWKVLTSAEEKAKRPACKTVIQCAGRPFEQKVGQVAILLVHQRAVDVVAVDHAGVQEKLLAVNLKRGHVPGAFSRPGTVLVAHVAPSCDVGALVVAPHCATLCGRRGHARRGNIFVKGGGYDEVLHAIRREVCECADPVAHHGAVAVGESWTRRGSGRSCSALVEPSRRRVGVERIYLLSHIVACQGGTRGIGAAHVHDTRQTRVHLQRPKKGGNSTGVGACQFEKEEALCRRRGNELWVGRGLAEDAAGVHVVG